MSSQDEDGRSLDKGSKGRDDVSTKPKIQYSREFLLSIGNLDICKKLPSRFEESLTSELEDALLRIPDRPRIPGSLPFQGFRRNELASSPPTRGETGSYYRGKWESRSSAQNDRGSNSQSDRDSDSARRYGNHSRRSWQTPEHDGLLGSGSFPRSSGYAAGISTCKVRANETNQLSRSIEPYHPPRPYKAVPHTRKDTDAFNDETLGSLECTGEDRAEQERRRRASFEMMRKEQHKALQEKQSSNLEEHEFVSKTWVEEIGLTPFTEYPKELQAKDYIKNRFPTFQYWKSDNFQKFQKFYELILIDTNSVEIVHKKNENGQIIYSKCIIKQVLSLSQWGKFTDLKSFSVRFIPKEYNYIDYKNAWYRTFYITPNFHSWLFTFHTSCQITFPIWFFEWWKRMGSEPSILPKSVLKGFEVFAENSNLKDYQKMLIFHTEFKVPWIFSWNFNFDKFYSDPTPLSILRSHKVKWWGKFQQEICSENSIKHFISTGNKIRFNCEVSSSSQKKKSNEKGKEKTKESSVENLSPQQKQIFEMIKQFPDIQSRFFDFMSKKYGKSNSLEESNSDPFGGPLAQDLFDF